MLTDYERKPDANSRAKQNNRTTTTKTNYSGFPPPLSLVRLSLSHRKRDNPTKWNNCNFFKAGKLFFRPRSLCEMRRE